ncbi:hypothetical protein SLS62_002395 [Diatrype stigma]|uniref:Glycerate dehydrogenase n=1 Tax=Diatrype stigma TaxID=117547 RepID=A0AAN9YS60_9PEZI
MHSRSETHLIIAALQTSLVPAPEFHLPAPYTCEVRQYASTAPDQVAERLRDADIATLSTLRLPAHVLSAAVSPRLKMVAVIASGTDSVDLAACRARGIAVSNTPHCNARAVAEHAIALYFDARRSLTLTHNLTRAGRWVERGSALAAVMDSGSGSDRGPPRTCRSETLGIVGYGGVGRGIESIARALGMRVLISGRKGQEPSLPSSSSSSATEGPTRTPFDTVVRESTVLALCLPRTPDTVSLVAAPELAAMRADAIVINVSRAGIVDEDALVAALRDRRIAGAAVDVHPVEPAGPGNSRLLAPDTAELNLIATPHTAWIAEDTIRNYQGALVENVASWLVTGRPKFQVV